MWKSQPSDRLDHWKQFRHRLASLPLEEALAECSAFWQKAPFTPYYLDYLTVDQWPTPWELVYENYYCDLAIALGIVYTLHLSGHLSVEDIGLRVYQDSETKHQYNLAWINQGKYILNMIDGEVLNIKQFDNALQLKQQFTAVDLQLDNYQKRYQ